MFERRFWRERVERGWRKAPIVWLTGVRRVGKTTLARGWERAEYFNCDLPRIQTLLGDPEYVYGQVRTGTVIFDEIHRLENPSEVLKIGADAFSQLRILATGSSTLAATRKFRDSLTGRKRVVHLTPVLLDELALFDNTPLEKRLLHGGLPDCLLADRPDPEYYSEWLDSYYARDVQELFAVGKRAAFLKLCGLLLRQSGEMLEVTSLAKHAGLSRPTVMSYLEVLEVTHFLNVLRPFQGGGRREIIAQPKAYGFDTGFVAHARGWEQLRPEDCGKLLEHTVLDVLRAHLPERPVHYWRDKQQREIDFVLPGPGKEVMAIECKWSREAFTTRNLDAFRAIYPKGRNLVVVGQTGDRHRRRCGDHEIEICTAVELPSRLLQR
ncbi:MAG: ATP-binding protein [Oceanipulchritudo sp.]